MAHSLDIEELVKMVVGNLSTYEPSDFLSEAIADSYEKVIACCNIIDVASILYKKSFFEGTSGNISVRLSDDTLMITPSGKAKNTLTIEDFVRTDLSGKIIEGTLCPSSEIKMHLAVYRNRRDVNAVIHAHPPYSVLYCVLHNRLNLSLLAESSSILSDLPVIKYAVPSTDEVPDFLIPHLATNNSFLLSNHGMLAVASDLKKAQYIAETLEFTARINFMASIAGGDLKELPDRK